jgi:hypothetical protein
VKRLLQLTEIQTKWIRSAGISFDYKKIIVLPVLLAYSVVLKLFYYIKWVLCEKSAQVKCCGDATLEKVLISKVSVCGLIFSRSSRIFWLEWPKSTSRTWQQWRIYLRSTRIKVSWTRVSSKRKKKYFGSNRNKPKQDLFRVCFGLFRETKKKIFRFVSVFRTFIETTETNRTVSKRTETIRNFLVNT